MAVVLTIILLAVQLLLVKVTPEQIMMAAVAAAAVQLRQAIQMDVMQAEMVFQLILLGD